MTVKSAVKFITESATFDDIACLLEAIRMRRDHLNVVNKFVVRVGQTVTFESRKTGLVRGVVVKTAVKKAQVKTDRGVTYAVPFDMLKAA